MFMSRFVTPKKRKICFPVEFSAFQPLSLYRDAERHYSRHFFRYFFRGKRHSWTKVTCGCLSLDPISVLACVVFAIQLHFIVLISTNHAESHYSVVVVKMQIARIFETSWKSWKKNFCSVPPTKSKFGCNSFY